MTYLGRRGAPADGQLHREVGDTGVTLGLRLVLTSCQSFTAREIFASDGAGTKVPLDAWTTYSWSAEVMEVSEIVTVMGVGKVPVSLARVLG